ncbi:DUF2637 domain-containing protein [Streptomyces sp. NPDC002851]
MAAMQLTRTHRILIGVVVAGAVVIAAIGFAGSYTAVRELAEKKGFGEFSYFFPIGIDAGICVLLALDLLLTWIRIPFPLLRQTAWLLTAATIAFNGAAAWPDPLGVGMHAVIPVLFVVAVEAARHAIGRIADITADKHMEGVRLTRWMLSPVPTFLLWRRMKLWELRSYEQVIKLEQERLVYQARLRSRFGRGWRRKAPVESLMPLRLARYGVPLAQTAPEGLAAAGIEPALLPPAPAPKPNPDHAEQIQRQEHPQLALAAEPQPEHDHPDQHADPEGNPWFAAEPDPQTYEGDYDPTYQPPSDDSGQADRAFPIPAGPGRTRPLAFPGPRSPETPEEAPQAPQAPQAPIANEIPEVPTEDTATLPDDVSREEAYFSAFHKYVSEHGDFPNARQFSLYLMDLYGVTGQSGGPLTEGTLRPYLRNFRDRYQQDLDADAEHIA